MVAINPNANGGDGKHIPLAIFTDRSQLLVSKSAGEVIAVALEDIGIPYTVNADGSLSFSPPTPEIRDRLFYTDNSVEDISGWSFDVSDGVPEGDTIFVGEGAAPEYVNLAEGVYFVTANVTVRKPAATVTDSIGTITLNTNGFDAGSTVTADVVFPGDFRSGQVSEVKVAVSAYLFVSPAHAFEGASEASLYVSGGKTGGSLQISDRSISVVRVGEYGA